MDGVDYKYSNEYITANGLLNRENLGDQEASAILFLVGNQVITPQLMVLH